MLPSVRTGDPPSIYIYIERKTKERKNESFLSFIELRNKRQKGMTRI